MTELATLQKRIWRLVTAPEGVAAALAAADGAAALEAWASADGRASARARLDVYAEAYFQRILEALVRDFERLAAALGDDGFHDLVTAFLCVHPPTRPSLRHAGDALPGFLVRHRAAAPFRRRWPFAPDLARFERASTDAFDAPDAPPLEADALASLAPEAWAGLVLDLHPSMHRLALAYDVGSLGTAEGGPAAPAADLHTLLVWRFEEGVCFRRAGEEEAALLSALERGAPFGELCETLAARHGAAEGPARAAGWLRSWVDAGMIRAARAR